MEEKRRSKFGLELDPKFSAQRTYYYKNKEKILSMGHDKYFETKHWKVKDIISACRNSEKRELEIVLQEIIKEHPTIVFDQFMNYLNGTINIKANDLPNIPGGDERLF